MKEFRMSLVILFIMKWNGDVRIDGDELWACPSFIIIMEVC